MKLGEIALEFIYKGLGIGKKNLRFQSCEKTTHRIDWKRALLTSMMLFSLPACQQEHALNAERQAQVQKNKDAMTYNIQLGMGYLKQGNSPRAKKKLLTALAYGPESAESHAAMAYYFEKTGDSSEARHYYQKALSLAPGEGAQLNNYGAYLCRQRQYDEADAYFLKAVKDVNYVNTAAAYENAGFCAQAQEKVNKAESYFIKALEQDSRRIQALFELTMIELKQKKPEEALAYLQKYQEQTFFDKTLLALAVKAAHDAGKVDLEADYRVRMSKLNELTNYAGVTDEYTHNNG